MKLTFEELQDYPTIKATTSYVIFIDAEQRAIWCRACGQVSYSQHDVNNRYCGHCHLFHEGI